MSQPAEGPRESRYHALIRASAQIVWTTDPTGAIVEEQPEWSAFTGQTAAEYHGLGWIQAVHPDDRARTAEVWEASLASGATYEIEHRIRRHDGEWRLVSVRAVPVRDASGTIREWIGSETDITDQRAAETALREREQEFRTLAESLPELAWSAHADGSIFWYNQRWYEFTGTTPEQMAGWGWQAVHDPAMLPAVLERWRESIRTRAPFEMEFPLRGSDGRFRWFLTRVVPLRNAAGEVVRWFGTNTNVDEQRAAARALQERQERLEAALRASGTGTFRWDIRTGALDCDESLDRLFGLPPGRTAATLDDFIRIVHPDDRALVVAACERCAAEGADFDAAYRVVWPDGSERWIDDKGKTVIGDDGRPAYMTGACVDITERVAREARLRDAERHVEAAQRLEAVGRLAGGVAHEVNNALTGVIGFAHLALRHVAADTPLRRDLEQILQGGQRAARVAQQLLAYSRRQLLQPRSLDLASVVRGFEPMLRQTVGPENELVIDAQPDAAWALADQAQLEQVLLNLVLNARDAMAYAGRVTIGVGVEEIRGAPRAVPHAPGVPPGSYVSLAVSDTGAGMSEETARRAFEPFFTTKPVGQGTGLGLSTVYGIVRQSDGHVWVESATGNGTTIRILLPRTAKPPMRSGPEGAREGPHATGTGTILIVDDEPSVAAFLQRLLQADGFDVHTAASGSEAVAIAERLNGQLDLVISDIVMPGTSGHELAARLATRVPGLPVLFVSGYTNDEIVRRGLLAPGAAFMQKPLDPDRLMEKVHVLMKGSPRGTSRSITTSTPAA